MLKITIFYLSISVILLLLYGCSTVQSFKDEKADATVYVVRDALGNPVSVAAVPIQKEREGDTSWVWGEVKAIDSASSTITISYLDYETEKESEIIVAVDQNTIFKNVSGLYGIKVGEYVSIDFIPKDGRYIAKNIELEKQNR